MCVVRSERWPSTHVRHTLVIHLARHGARYRRSANVDNYGSLATAICRWPTYTPCTFHLTKSTSVNTARAERRKVFPGAWNFAGGKAERGPRVKWRVERAESAPVATVEPSCRAYTDFLSEASGDSRAPCAPHSTTGVLRCRHILACNNTYHLAN